MKAIHFAILGILIVIFGSVGTYLGLQSYYHLETVKIPMDVEVNDYVGINLDTDALHFGTILNSGSARRNITINNTYGMDVRVKISAEGDMKDWLEGYENTMILEEGQAKKVEFTVQPPEYSKYGEYNGSLFITFYKN